MSEAHTPLATLRRDLNSEMCALANMTGRHLLEDRAELMRVKIGFNRLGLLVFVATVACLLSRIF